MKKLDKFLLTSFIGPFVLILLVVIFILVMQTLWVYIDELVGKGLDFRVILEFLFWGSCTILPLALPLATLLASMMTLGSMGENNELIALKAAGVSVSRVMAPIMIASVFISIGTYFVINELVPVAYNQIYTLRDDIITGRATPGSLSPIQPKYVFRRTSPILPSRCTMGSTIRRPTRKLTRILPCNSRRSISPSRKCW